MGGGEEAGRGQKSGREKVSRARGHIYYTAGEGERAQPFGEGEAVKGFQACQ